MKIKLIILLCLFILTGLQAFAELPQTEWFDNDKEWRYAYGAAYGQSDKGAQQKYADALFTAAGKRHDTKQQAEAMLIKARYYDATMNTKQFKVKACSIMKWMRKTKNYDGCYYLWTSIILNSCTDKRYVEAFIEIERMKIQAQKDKCAYGIQAAYRMTGHLYRARLMYNEALKAYRKELAYARKIHSASLYSCYYNIACCEYHLGLHHEAMASAEKGRSYTHIPLVQMRFNALEGIFCGITGDYARLGIRYEQVDKYIRSHKADIDLHKLYDLLNVEILWSQNRFDKAMERINRLEKSDRMMLLPFHYMRKGDTQMAFKAQGELTQYSDSLKEVMSSADMNAINYKMKERQLMHERQQLAEENAHIEMIQVRVTAACILLVLFAMIGCMAIIIVMQRKKNTIIAAENESKKQFIRGMSHEIRTPLNGISGFTEILSDNDYHLSEEDIKSSVGMIRKCTDQLTVILNSMLELSDYESGLAQFKFAGYNVHDLCKEALKAAFEHRPDKVEMDMHCGVPAEMTLVTDRERIMRILISLLINACTNTKEGAITIGCNLTENHGKLTFYVEDTGCGIPDDKAEEIFKRFVKLNQFKPGIGVGLTIDRAIAGKMRSTLSLDTSYKGGARFVLVHPLNLKESVSGI